MTKAFRVIIAGSRGFSDYPLLAAKCDKLLSRKAKDTDIIIVSGTARGADQLGERYAAERGYRVERYPADWQALGKKAGMVRNQQMVDHADALVAFWDGLSHGTSHTIEAARRRGITVRVVYCQSYLSRAVKAVIARTTDSSARFFSPEQEDDIKDYLQVSSTAMASKKKRIDSLWKAAEKDIRMKATLDERKAEVKAELDDLADGICRVAGSHFRI